MSLESPRLPVVEKYSPSTLSPLPLVNFWKLWLLRGVCVLCISAYIEYYLLNALHETELEAGFIPLRLGLFDQFEAPMSSQL